MAQTRRNPVAKPPNAQTLTRKQAALVRTILDAAAEGTKFPTRQQLGTLAGYGEGEIARTSACRALALPHVRQAIREGLQELSGVDVARAYQTLRIAAEKAPSARDRIAAANRILGLAGLGSGDTYGGPSVAIQLVFNDPTAAAMLQVPPVPMAGQVIEAAPIMED